MLTPRVFELPIAPPFSGRDGKHGENAEQDRLRAPRREPYHRASQRELVYASIMADLHTHGYDHHDHDRRES